MQNIEYVFPEQERKNFVNSGRILLFFELVLHCFFIILAIIHQEFSGVWVSLFFAVVFGLVHFVNLSLRKYCLAQWSYDETGFVLYVKNMIRVIDTSQPFCVATTKLSFPRPYSPAKYPFILIWKPGVKAPYAEMGGYQALKKCDVVVIPYDDKTISIMKEYFNIQEIPSWPKSGVYHKAKISDL